MAKVKHPANRDKLSLNVILPLMSTSVKKEREDTQGIIPVENLLNLN